MAMVSLGTWSTILHQYHGNRIESAFFYHSSASQSLISPFFLDLYQHQVSACANRCSGPLYALLLWHLALWQWHHYSPGMAWIYLACHWNFKMQAILTVSSYGDAVLTYWEHGKSGMNTLCENEEDWRKRQPMYTGRNGYQWCHWDIQESFRPSFLFQ